MTLQMFWVLLVVGGMLIALVLEVARPDMVVLLALGLLMLSGVLTTEEALRGFSNEGMLTIALLFIVAGAVQQSGFFQQVLTKLLDNSRHRTSALLRLMLPTSFLSAFMNNTPIVATLTPLLRQWCDAHDLAPSKFLIPLSYATILGGTITLIGTSTNLVVHGMLLQNGLPGFHMFQLAWVGVPQVIVGTLYMLTLGQRLLPERKVTSRRVREEVREYMAEVVVEPHFPYVGKTVEEAGLRHLEGLFLVEIIRGEEHITPVSSATRLHAGDRLIFTGKLSTLAELQRRKGLRLETGSDLSFTQLNNGEAQLVEVVVSDLSPLLRKKVRDSQFRSRYDAAVIAVHRNQQRIQGKIGEIVLRPGDTLLLLVGADFWKRQELSRDFYVVTPLDASGFREVRSRGWVTIGIFLAGILLVTFQVLSMFQAMAMVVILLLLLRLTTPEAAKRSMQFQILLIIAGAFGIGTAITKTGTAAWVADGLLRVADGFGVTGALVVVFLLTALFTEMITNSAAAAMMFPISMEMASAMGVDPMAFAVTITIAASASFATPIGYQTNLIVYGPGGYRFRDYLRVGIPLTFLSLMVTVGMVSWVWV